jgi:hypothetical protein
MWITNKFEEEDVQRAIAACKASQIWSACG